MTVHDFSLSPEEVHRLAANSPPGAAWAVDDTQCLDVLAMLQRCSEQLSFECAGSQADAGALGSRVLLPLLRIACGGPPLTQIAALRLCQKTLPRFSAKVVDSHAANAMNVEVIGGDKKDSMTFLNYLFDGIGSCLNVWSRFGLGASGTAAPCDDMRLGVAMEQIELLRVLISCPEWDTAIGHFLERAIASVADISSMLISGCQTEITHQQNAQAKTPFQFNPELGKYLASLYAVIGLLGGSLDALCPGTRAGYSRGDAAAALEECIVVAPTWPPVVAADDKEAEALWAGVPSRFGEATVVSLSSAPSKPVVVPTNRLLVTRSDQNSTMLNFFSRHTQSIIALFRHVVLVETVDPRPVYLPDVQESDKTLVFESPHPYTSNMDTFKEVSLPGATEIVIQFDSQSRTENGCDYVKFYKDVSKTAYWGAEKYSGRNNEFNWPGVAGREPLVIPGDFFL